MKTFNAHYEIHGGHVDDIVSGFDKLEDCGNDRRLKRTIQSKILIWIRIIWAFVVRRNAGTPIRSKVSCCSTTRPSNESNILNDRLRKASVWFFNKR